MTATEKVRRALAQGDATAVVALVAASWRELLDHGGREGAELIGEAATLTREARPSKALATLRYAAGLIAFRSGDNARCRELSQSALEVAITVSSDEEQARAHVGLSRADFRDRRYDSALAHAEAAAALAESAGADDLAVSALHMRAEITRARGDYPAAVPLYERLLAADEAAGDLRSLAMEHYNLGSVLVQSGDLGAAREHLQASYALLDQAPGQAVYTLLAFGGLAARDGDPALAGQLLGAVHAELDRRGEVLDPAEQLELDSHVTVARNADASAYDTAYTAGRALSLDEACRLIT